MADGQGWGVPPNMPPPAPASNFVPQPPVGMPPPVPGTGASQSAHAAPACVPMQTPVVHPGVYLRPDKSLGVAYVLWFFLGFLGVHHFYLGKVGRGVGYLLTCGWFFIGLLIDLFTLPPQVQRVNAERRVGLR